MSLTASASGLVVFLLYVQGTVHLHLYCEAVHPPPEQYEQNRNQLLKHNKLHFLVFVYSDGYLCI